MSNELEEEIRTNIHMAHNIRTVIEANGWDMKDPNFEGTPRRVKKWMANNLSTKDLAITQARHYGENTFPTDNDQMLVQGPIRVYGLCPHHLLPVEYDIWIGVLLKDKSLGLSKYTRMCEALAKYPWLQEDLTSKIGDILEERLKCNGVMVMVEGVHFCMKMRGVKQQNPLTVTNEIRGWFEKPPKGRVSPKQEFLDTVSNIKRRVN